MCFGAFIAYYKAVFLCFVRNRILSDRKLFRNCSVFFIIVFLLVIFSMDIQDIYAGEIAGGEVTDTEGNRCGTLRWSLSDDGIFTVTGSGPGATYRPEGKEDGDKLCPWNDYRSEIRYVQFNCVFTGAALYHFEYGASLNSWFVNCTNLEGYSDIPYGVTDMSAAFYNCTSLKQCGAIPDSVITLMYAFHNCKSMVHPPVLSSGLRDDCYEKYHDKNVMVASSALGMTFAGCESLLVTPDFGRCTRIKEMIGTFTDCSSLETIQNIPANITYLFDTFRNCAKVRGIFSCEADAMRFNGRTFENFAQNNDYILFVKANDRAVYEKMRHEAGENFRGYVWDELFTVFFVTNGGNDLPERKIVMEYGAEYTNEINHSYQEQVNKEYYKSLPAILGDFPIPYRSGLTFDGWYLDSGLTQPLNADNLVNPPTQVLNQKSLILYARWADRQNPEIVLDYLDRDWSRVPVTVEFSVSDNINGGLRQILLQKKEGEDTIVYHEFQITEGILTEKFSYTFGNIESRLFEGITHWQLVAEDLSGNVTRTELTIRLDYTPPVIYTDSVYDEGGEIVYDDRKSVLVWGEDVLSGMGLLRINPSDYQNTYLDKVLTPYRMEDFSIAYDFYGDEKRFGYVLYAEDRAGNISTRVIVTKSLLSSHVKRVVPRENYD